MNDERFEDIVVGEMASWNENEMASVGHALQGVLPGVSVRAISNIVETMVEAVGRLGADAERAGVYGLMIGFRLGKALGRKEGPTRTSWEIDFDPEDKASWDEIRAYLLVQGLVEVLDERNNLRAAIYPGDDDNEIRVVSKYLEEVVPYADGVARVFLRPEP